MRDGLGRCARVHVGLSTYRCACVHSGAHLALGGLLPLCHQFSAKSEDSRSGRSMEQDKASCLLRFWGWGSELLGQALS